MIKFNKNVIIISIYSYLFYIMLFYFNYYLFFKTEIKKILKISHNENILIFLFFIKIKFFLKNSLFTND